MFSRKTHFLEETPKTRERILAVYSKGELMFKWINSLNNLHGEHHGEMGPVTPNTGIPYRIKERGDIIWESEPSLLPLR